MKDHYKILGLLKEADEVVIKAAYKALAQKYHPDKHPGEKAEYNKFKSEINEAYAVIGFKHKRKDYDLKWARSAQKGKSQKPREDSAPSKEDSKHHGGDAHKDHEHNHHTKEKNAEHEHEHILKKLHSNQMDEYQLIELFEKVFSLKIQISSGYINNYSYTKDDKVHIVNFEKIKLDLINHLTQ